MKTILRNCYNLLNCEVEAATGRRRGGTSGPDAHGGKGGAKGHGDRGAGGKGR